MSLILGMAGIGMQFNAGQHAERSIDPVPEGWYPVMIVGSEIKPTKTPGGARLNLQFKIQSGDFAGRVIFGGYNVQNANPVAVQIAMEELAELSRAVNVPVWNDTEQLHGIMFNLKVKIKKSEGYNDSNEPQQYKHIQDMAGVRYATKADIKQGAAPVSGAFAQQPAQQPQQTQQPQQGWGQPGATQQQPVQQQVQQPVQQNVQQPVQQQPQQGAVNFNQAAQSQPWGQNNTQQPTEQQPQQQAQQPVQEQQPVQQPQVQTQTQQQPVQQQQPLEGEHIPANAGGQPSWAQQQVQPGTEQPVQQNNVQQQVQEPADDIQQAAQSQTPPWKQQAQ